MNGKANKKSLNVLSTKYIFKSFSISNKYIHFLFTLNDINLYFGIQLLFAKLNMFSEKLYLTRGFLSKKTTLTPSFSISVLSTSQNYVRFSYLSVTVTIYNANSKQNLLKGQGWLIEKQLIEFSLRGKAKKPKSQKT